MELSIPKIDVSEMNCKTAAVASIFASYGFEPSVILCNALCFSYSDEDALCGDNIHYGGLSGEEESLEYLFGFTMEEKQIADKEIFLSLIEERLSKGYATVIRGSIFNCPFNSKKFPVNYTHLSIINGVSEDRTKYRIFDSFLKVYDQYISKEEIETYLESYIVYQLEPAEAKLDAKDKKALYEYSVKNLLIQSKTDQFDKGMEHLADAIEDDQNFANLVTGSEEYFYRLSNTFAEAKACNNLYRRFLKDALPNQDAFSGLSDLLSEITDTWDAVIGLVLKAYILRNPKDNRRYEISENIRKTAQLQRELLDMLMENR